MKYLPSICARRPLNFGQEVRLCSNVARRRAEPFTRTVGRRYGRNQNSETAHPLCKPASRGVMSAAARSLWGFLHYCERMTVGIGEERHPEIVIVHLRDQMRLVLERDAASGQLTDGERDVRAAKVDAAARVTSLISPAGAERRRSRKMSGRRSGTVSAGRAHPGRTPRSGRRRRPGGRFARYGSRLSNMVVPRQSFCHTRVQPRRPWAVRRAKRSAYFIRQLLSM